MASYNTSQENNSSSASHLPWFLWYRTPQTLRVALVITYTAIVSFSLLGDIALVAIICKYKHMRTKGNYLVLNMAVSDIAAMLVLTREIYVRHTQTWTWDVQDWFGDALCKISTFIRDVSVSVSIHSMVFLTLNRFFAVVHPTRPAPRLLAPRVVIPLTWITAFATFGVYFRVYRTITLYGNKYCVSIWEPPFDPITAGRDFYLVFMTSLFIIPLPLMATVYMATARKLKRQAIPGEALPENEKRRRKRNKNVVLMAVTVTASFMICWIPQHTLVILHNFFWDETLSHLAFEELKEAFDIVVAIAYACFAVNPFICFVFSESLRKAVTRLLQDVRTCNTRILASNTSGAITLDTQSAVEEGNSRTYDTRL